MASSLHPDVAPDRTRPLTRAVVACVVAGDGYLLIQSVAHKLFTLGLIFYLGSLVALVVAAVYAFKRLHQFWTGDRDLQHSAGDQIFRAVLIGGLIHFAGMAIRPERPEAPQDQVQGANVPYKVPTQAQEGSLPRLAEYVSRCALTQDEQGLVLQTSDGGLRLMDVRTGALVSPPAEAGVSFDAMASRARWSVSEVSLRSKENRVVHTRDEQRQVDLGRLGLQYIGPAAAPDQFIAFHRTTPEFQRLDVSTGAVVWRLPFEFVGLVGQPEEGVRLLNPAHSWSLMTCEASDRRLRYLLLIDDPTMLAAAGLEDEQAGKPQMVFLDPVMPAMGTQSRYRIRELVQVPGTTSFLMAVQGNYADAHYVRFRLQRSGSELGLISESVVPHGHALIRPSLEGPDPTLGLQGPEIVLEAGGHPSWRPLEPQRHNPPIPGFSVALERDVLLPSPVEGRLELLRAGQGYLPWVAEFPGRSFARDRHCVAQSAQGHLVAIALGPQLRVLFKSRTGEVDAIRQWRIDLPIDAKAAMDGAARR